MTHRFAQITIILLATLFAPGSPAAANQQDAFPPHIGRWRASSPAVKEKLLDQDAAIYKEAGVVDSFEREYSSDGHALVLSIAAFRDPTGAYQAFTFRRFREMPDGKLTDTSAVQNDRALLLVGNFVVGVRSLAPETAAADLIQIDAQLRPRADTTPLPPIRTYLPAKGRVPGSDLYASGPVAFRSAMGSLGQPDYAALAQEADMSSGAEAVAAHYRNPAGDGVLLLIEYPTPQLAEQQLHHLELALAQKLKKSDITVDRKASLLSIVFGSTNPAFVKGLRNEVNYETSITWNEPVFSVTEPPIISTMVKIFVGTGVFMLAAVVLGIAFGGVRIATKALFPGKVFDRPDQIEILQLRLSDKRPVTATEGDQGNTR
jgi:hypothetical protein